jgi:hypothetical protein
LAFAFLWPSVFLSIKREGKIIADSFQSQALSLKASVCLFPHSTHIHTLFCLLLPFPLSHLSLHLSLPPSSLSFFIFPFFHAISYRSGKHTYLKSIHIWVRMLLLTYVPLSKFT